MSKPLEDPNWGSNYKGIPGGRDIGKEYVETYYGKNKPSGRYKGVSSYEDYRELLVKEPDVDVVKIMTPDHHHAFLVIEAMKKGKHVVTHKPIANRMSEGRLAIETAKKSNVKTHLLAWSKRPEHALILKWIKEGVIGNLREIHNWSYRPVWEQWPSRPKESKPIPDGFNWELWLGPVPDLDYRTTRIIDSADGTTLEEAALQTWDITASSPYSGHLELIPPLLQPKLMGLPIGMWMETPISGWRMMLRFLCQA